KNTKILRNCQVRAKRYSESLISEARSGGQEQEQEIRTKFKNQKSKAIKDKKERLRQVKSEYEKRMTTERRLFDNRIETIEEEISDLISVRWSGLDFTDESWNNYKPIMNGGGKIPRLTRMGELTGKGENVTINLPGLLPIIGEGHVFLKASGKMKDKAIETMQCLMLRLLATLPAAKLKFILIDPNGLGRNMSWCLNLPDDLIGGKPWTEENHIEKCLFDLTRHMEMVIQKYLTNRFDNMEEYNSKAGEVAEPYRIVAITDFPTRFTESSAQRLLSIALNGPKTGVHIIATLDKNHPIPHGFQLSELERTGRVIEFNKNRIVLPDKAFWGYQFELDNLPSPEQFNRIAIPIGEASKTAQKVIVPFDQIVPDLSKWWQDYSGKGVSAPIGRFGAQDHLFFEFGQSTAHHGLIAGRTGFGKSKLILVDEIDGLSGTKDRGGLLAITKLIEKSSFPIILTATNPWDYKFNKLRRKTEMIEFAPLEYLIIFEILKKLNLAAKEYATLTLHRPSNVDNEHNFNKILGIIDEIRQQKMLNLMNFIVCQHF
ncbi:MAG: hypothetical protein IH823_01840, partial [Candidatus Dadabacteria bacterium]|nr:hypothetical protein [Candidatus Dadabacteria bacterium]